MILLRSLGEERRLLLRQEEAAAVINSTETLSCPCCAGACGRRRSLSPRQLGARLRPRLYARWKLTRCIVSKQHDATLLYNSTPPKQPPTSTTRERGVEKGRGVGEEKGGGGTAQRDKGYRERRASIGMSLDGSCRVLRRRGGQPELVAGSSPRLTLLVNRDSVKNT